MVAIPAADAVIEGRLVLAGKAMWCFAGGSGSSRYSPRSNYVARVLYQAQLGTLPPDCSNGACAADKLYSLCLMEGSRMKARITVITIGVDDLERSLRFYRDGLGLKTEGIIGEEFEHGAVAFFDLQTGLKLAIWPRESISHDSGLALGSPSATEFTLGHNVASKAEVNAVMEQAKNAGAVIVKPAHDTFWGGYAGYIQDPDQHLWEIVWNPQWLVQD